MQAVYDFGIVFVLFVQSLGDWLAAPMLFFSSLGRENFFLLLVPVIYWLMDARFAVRLGLMLMFSIALHEGLKLLFHTPRPYWLDGRVLALDTEISFGMPSGHAQDAVLVWGLIASQLRRRWAWLAAGALAFLIGSSRIYLGVHFPWDTLLGWTLGGVLLWAVLRFEQPLLAWLRRFSLPARIALASAFSLLLILLLVMAKTSLQTWQTPSAWLENAAAAGQALTVEETRALSVAVAGVGTFLGIAVGVIWLHGRGGFDPRGDWKQLAGRLLIGMTGMALLFLLREIFPSGESALAMILRFARYTLMGAWAGGLAPWLFCRLKLAESIKRV